MFFSDNKERPVEVARKAVTKQTANGNVHCRKITAPISVKGTTLSDG